MTYPPYFTNTDFNSLYKDFQNAGFKFQKPFQRLDNEFQTVNGWFHSNLSNIQNVKYLLIAEACPPDIPNYIYNTSLVDSHINNNKTSPWIIEPVKAFTINHHGLTKDSAISILNAVGALLVDVFPFYENYSLRNTNPKLYSTILGLSLNHYFLPKIHFINNILRDDKMKIMFAGTKVMGDVLINNHVSAINTVFAPLGGNNLLQERSFYSPNNNSTNPPIWHSSAQPTDEITECGYQHYSGNYKVGNISKYISNVCDVNGPKSTLIKVVCD